MLRRALRDESAAPISVVFVNFTDPFAEAGLDTDQPALTPATG
jgi:hypothetical protein